MPKPFDETLAGSHQGIPDPQVAILTKVFCTNIYHFRSLENESPSLTLCVGFVCLTHKDVGEIATSITYIHVAIPLNLTNIRNLAKQFGRALSLTTELRIHFNKDHLDDHFKRLYWDDNYV